MRNQSRAFLALTAMLGLDTPLRLPSPFSWTPMRVHRAPAVGGSRVRGRSTKRGYPGSKRLAPAIYGGNWQGLEYLTYREHDMLTRLTRLGPAPLQEMGLQGPLTREQAMEIMRQRRPQ